MTGPLPWWFGVVRLMLLVPAGVPVSAAEAMRPVSREFLERLIHWMTAGKMFNDRPEILKVIRDHLNIEVPDDTPILHGGGWSPEELGSLAHDLKENGFPFSAKYLEKKIEEKKPLQIRSELPILVGRIWDELEDVAWIRLDPERRRQWRELMQSFDEDASDRFPTAFRELDEAAECFLFERNTGAVFHLMRATEVALKEISKALGIPDPTKPAERNWGRFLKTIREKIESNDKEKPEGWSEQKPFFEEIQGDLVSVKNAWRDNTMHIEHTYDDRRAINIFRATLELFRHLATQLRERFP